MELIEMRGIHKYYNKGTASQVHALRGADLTVSRGEMVAILGKSGSGKSTLLHIMGCIDTADEGYYYLEDKEAGQCSQKELAALRNRKIGFVLQEFGLILHKSVYENITYPLLFHPQVKNREIPARVKQVLELVGIPEKADSKVEELSGGQKQRAAIARALVNDPEILLADEPTGALDSETSREIMELMKSLNEQGKTVVIVTHDPLVAEYCRRKVVITDGIIEEDHEAGA